MQVARVNCASICIPATRAREKNRELLTCQKIAGKGGLEFGFEVVCICIPAVAGLDSKTIPGLSNPTW